MRAYSYILIILIGVLFSCSEEENNLPSAEDRKNTAINNLKDDLVRPVNGWRLNYRPNIDNGAYLILLDFNDDGTVTINSDVAGDGGTDFFEQQIRYRIDATLGLELIFETYGVFHYLFEQQRATFGGEFVFTYLEEEDGNLLFESKTDVTDKTMLEFTPAQPSDINLFSTELAENLNKFSGLTPQTFGGLPPIQHLALIDKGISVFWSLNLLARTINVDVAGMGITLDEVLIANNYVSINHTTSYTIQNNKIILDNAFSFTLNGENSTISEVSLSSFDVENMAFCPSENVEFPVSRGDISGISSIVVRKSLFSSKGLSFTPMTKDSYSVNVLFVFDESSRSLLQSGSISEKFPNARAFVFNYGLSSATEPENAIGLIIRDDSGQSKTYLRELTLVEREGNKLTIELADLFYYSETPGVNDEQNLMDITNEIFEGGVIYLYDLPVEDSKVFRLFNPCNQYELFLVQ